MVHLMAAYKYRPDSLAEFWVGNIAPDCIEDWKERDKFHFRDISDKEKALRDFSKSYSNDLFSEGMLFHLFVDCKWDKDLRQQYIKNCGSDDWFQSYRNEIGLLSAWFYHNIEWSKKVWEDMLTSDISKYAKIDKTSPEIILSKIQQANQYHLSNPLAKPLFYSISTIEEFTAKTANDYLYWRNIVK